MVIDIGISLVFGTVLAGIFIIPSYVIFLVIMIRLKIKWNNFSKRNIKT